jgi:hypothetical protein
MIVLPFDSTFPPSQAPEECTNQLMWDLSYMLLCAHWQDDDDVCVTCGPDAGNTCRGRSLAIRGLVESVQLVEFAVQDTAVSGQ